MSSSTRDIRNFFLYNIPERLLIIYVIDISMNDYLYDNNIR
jgi:hypothetical protein